MSNQAGRCGRSVELMSSLLGAVKGDRSYVFMGETAAVGQNRRSWTRFLPTGSRAAPSR
jgi:hypothetical protein